MYWIDVAMIMFSCVASNHLGLIGAIEHVIGHKLFIINCSRCFTFWSVLMFMMFTTMDYALSFATSFLSAALAPWLELLMGFTDKLYNRLYDTIYTTTEDEGNGETKLEEDSRSTMS